jgi:hypothetical protein
LNGSFVLGVALGSGGMAYFLARDYFRKRRARGGMSRAAKRRSKAAPALIAVATAVASSGFGFRFLVPRPVSSDSGQADSVAPPALTPAAKAERMSSFFQGCMEGCLKNNEQSTCQGYCDCMKVELDRRLGNATKLANSEMFAAVHVCDPQNDQAPE